MRKIFTILMMAVCVIMVHAASYGILVNGNTYFAGAEAGENEGFTQYLAHVSVKSGDKLQLFDKDNDAAWAVTLSSWSVEGFTRDGDHYNASVTGCYDFYIKLKYGADELYIGNGSGCGEGEPYGPTDPDVKFYITGNEALVTAAGLTSDKAWTSDAILSEKDTFVLNLPAGEFALKVTVNGKWGTAKGFDALTEVADGLMEGSDKNICFTLAKAGQVKVIYTSSVFKLIGDFYVKPIDKSVMYLVPSEEWLVADAKFAAWIWGDKIEAQWTDFFAPISAGNDTLKASINPQADSIAFIRFSPKTTAPTWEQKGEDVLVWGETKDKVNYSSMVWTVVGWDKGQWTPVEKKCESYGLLVDGNFVPGKKNVLQSEWTEYMLRSVSLEKGQKVQIYDACSKSAWVMEKFAETSYTFPIQEIGGIKYYIIEENGSYDFYIKFIYENDEVYVSKAGSYTTAVREQCEDVMMQAFFYDSYGQGASGEELVGNTKWTTLTPQADEIGHYFDLIWLPPSAYGSGTGYHPKNYCDQNSNWGSAAELSSLISALHKAGSKVIADIVINHCEGWTSWCDFPTLNFGEYGTFYPDASYICKNDEVNGEWNKESAGSCYGKATGNYDDGENWDGARDWSHDNVYVQDMFKAYLKWMRNVVGYDGFRYDKGDGFNNWHHDNYNKAAGPYIAFMECYSNTDEIWGRIQGANYNLMGLDFDTKWHVFDAIAGWNYGGKNGNPRGDGLLGRNNGRYAVTFIDSHDWFMRGDNENEFGGRGNSLTAELKIRLLQANAFLLSMPGVPCVFYPHWYKYKEFIKPMIEARKWAGVHSESAVSDEYVSEGGAGYQATIAGKYGYLILCLGDKAKDSGDHKFGENYVKKASYYNYSNDRENYEIWVHRTAPIPTAIDEVNEQPVVKAEKFMENGQLYIRRGERIYDSTGRMIK